MDKPVLFTIPLSHYGERARWALDLAGADYDERHHLQMFAWGPALLHARQKNLPILCIGPRVLRSSSEILAYAADERGAPLFPVGVDRTEIERASELFAGDFGVATRRVAYEWMFRVLRVSLPFNAGRAPFAERFMLSTLRKPAKAFATWYLDAKGRPVDEAREVVSRTLDDVAKRIADGRPYLFGDVFTAADLTFASMMAPAVLPPHHPVPLPQPHLLPKAEREAILATRSHPAGAFALRIYSERPLARGTYERQVFVRTRAATRL